LIPDRQDKIIQSLKSVFKSETSVRGMFLSGSLARGKSDELSDIDLYVIAENKRTDSLFERLPQIVAEIEPVMFSLRTKTSHHSAVFVFNDLTECSLTILNIDELHPSPVYEYIESILDSEGIVEKISSESKHLPVQVRIDTLLRIEYLFLWGALALRKRILRDSIWDARDALEKLRYLVIQMFNLRAGTLDGYKGIEGNLESAELLKLSKTASAYDKDAILSSVSMCFDMFEELRDEMFSRYSLTPDQKSTKRVKETIKGLC
jgi:predicted nucleotidyltransferase